MARKGKKMTGEEQLVGVPFVDQEKNKKKDDDSSQEPSDKKPIGVVFLCKDGSTHFNAIKAGAPIRRMDQYIDSFETMTDLTVEHANLITQWEYNLLRKQVLEEAFDEPTPNYANATTGYLADEMGSARRFKKFGEEREKAVKVALDGAIQDGSIKLNTEYLGEQYKLKISPQERSTLDGEALLAELAKRLKKSPDDIRQDYMKTSKFNVARTPRRR